MPANTRNLVLMRAAFVQFIAAVVAAASIGCDSRRESAVRREPLTREAAPVRRIPTARFASDVLQSRSPVLVEFGVDSGCFRCADMQPRVSSLATTFEGKAKVVRLDFQQEADLAREFGVTVCPTYLVFDKGRLVDRYTGPTTALLLSSRLQGLLDSRTPVKAN